MAVWYAASYTLMWRAAVRVYMHNNPTRADVHICVDRPRKEVDVLMNHLQSLPIDQYIQISLICHLGISHQKPQDPKSFL